MTWVYTRAEDGNVALTGEIDLQSSGSTFLIALGFGKASFKAGNRALASLLEGFDVAKETYTGEW
jgi:glucoamylase